MWAVNGQDLKMTEGDWGIQLPVTIDGTTLTANDELKLTIKTAINGDIVVEKTFSNISQNTVNLVFNAQESALFSVGTYVYALDWFQNGAFVCNIIPAAMFKVVEKA